jgi:hypothetical protein
VGFKRSLTCLKVLRHGTSGFTSSTKEGLLRIFIALKIHRLGWVRTRELWVQWKHTNHYTTEATITLQSHLFIFCLMKCNWTCSCAEVSRNGGGGGCWGLIEERGVAEPISHCGHASTFTRIEIDNICIGYLK